MKTAGHKAPSKIRMRTVRIKDKTCGKVLKGLRIYVGHGFLTKEGAAAIEEAKRKPVLLRRNVKHFQNVRGLKVVAH